MNDIKRPMASFKKIYNLDFNSAFVRSLLSLYYRPGRFYKIPFGPLAGLEIWYERSINYHAILGLWEKANFYALKRVLANLLAERGHLNVYDIGANIGLYTLFASRLSRNISVVAFEPVKDTISVLKKNLDKNGMQNVIIVEKAAGRIEGEVSFFLGHHHKSSLEREWTSDRGMSEVDEIKVQSTTIDSFIKNNPNAVADLIKVDVEGGGAKVLEGAKESLAKHRPILLFESHVAVEDQAIIQLLRNFDYKGYRINDGKWISNPGMDYRDRHGVWGTMLLFPGEREAEFLRVLK